MRFCAPTPQGARLCVTQLLGYRISSGDLLREALTHCSWPAGPCYQRLEFLGDALLDLCASDIIWREGDRWGPEGDGCRWWCWLPLSLPTCPLCFISCCLIVSAALDRPSMPASEMLLPEQQLPF